MESRVAVVTGGSRGIGKAVAIELAGKGFNIVVNYSSREEKAMEVVKQCQEFGVKAMAIKANVSVDTECKAMIDAVVENFGRIDVLVNNAGITRDNLIMRMSEEEFDQVIDTNLKGAFLCIKNVCRIMMKQRYGRIVNISSVVGVRGNAGQINYSASKAGIIGMTKSAAKELASRNITVNAVAPGFIKTDMTAVLKEDIQDAILKQIPLNKLGEAYHVARAVSFFAEECSEYITGQVLCVDGGMAI